MPLVKFVGVRQRPQNLAGDEDEARRHARRSSRITRGCTPAWKRERVLALTREYLFDVFRLRSDGEHTYDWMVQALGSAEPDDPDAWQPTETLDKFAARRRRARDCRSTTCSSMRSIPAAETWSLNAVQTAMTTNLDGTVLGPEWYNRRVGVRVTMLGEPGTRAFFARRPLRRKLTREESRDPGDRDRTRFDCRPRSETYNKVDSADHGAPDPAADRGDDQAGDREEIKKNKKPFKPVGVVAET